MKDIFITLEDHQILADILGALSCDVLVFGSRIKGTHQKFSDLDLCLKANRPIDLADIAMLKATLSESNLPFTVDVIDYTTISDSFKKIIDRDGINFRDTKAVL